jgi:hypothetical protein
VAWLSVAEVGPGSGLGALGRGRRPEGVADGAAGDEIASGTVSGYVSGATRLMGPVAPQFYHPADSDYDTIPIFIAGPLSAGSDQRRHHPHRPLLVKDVFLDAGTSPGTQSLMHEGGVAG